MQEDQKNTDTLSAQDLQKIGEIKASLETATQNLERVKKIVEDIDTYNTIFIELKVKLSDTGSGLNATYDTTQKIKGDIEKLKIGSEEGLKAIKELSDSVKSSVEEITSSHKNFLILKTKVEDPASGLNAILSKSQSLKEDIEKIKQVAENNLQEVKDALTNVKEKVTNLSQTYDQFLATKAKVDDPNSGLEATLVNSTELMQKISAVQGQANTLFEEIKKFRDESQSHTKDISNLKQKAETYTQSIGSLEKESQEYKAKIIEIYKIATGSGLANSFDARKKEIEKSLKTWYQMLILGTIILLAVVLAIYFTALFRGTLGQSAFWYKLTFSSPIIFFVIFATERYTHERNLLEKYAFKATTALALENYTTLLRNTFKDEKHEKQILDFVLDSMETIYKEPFEAKKESKWTLGIDSKLGEVKAELAEVKEEIEKIPRSTSTKE